MLDLKLIRSDPERVKAALARRGAADEVDELLALDARRRELLPEIESAQAERKTLSKQIGEAKQRGEDAEDADRRGAGAEGDDRGGQGRAGARSRPSSSGSPPALPNLPDPDAPDGMTEEDAVVAPRGRRAARVRLRAARPPRDRHRARPDRHGERGAQRLRLALRLPQGRPGAARAGAGPLRDRAGPRRGPRAGGAAGPGPRRGRSTGPASCPATATRSTRSPRTSSSWSAPPRSRSPACTPTRSSTPARPAAALRRLLDLLPPRGRRRRPRHPRHLPRPPVRQGRDVLVRRARGVRRRARAPAGDRGADPRRARDPLPGRRTSPSATSAPRPRRSTTARPGSRARAATAS